MARHFIIATRRLQSVGAFCLAGLALAASLPGRTAEASPQTLVLPDPDAVAENDELARAVAFLVRSSLSQVRVVPRRELALALEASGSKRSGQGLQVPADAGAKLVERMGCDALVQWRIEVGGKGMTVAGAVVGPSGKRLLRLSAVAATGDVTDLARKLTARLAAALGGLASPIGDTGLAELRPFLAADVAMLGNDPVAASRAVELASPAVVGKIAEAKATLQSLAGDPAMTALPRAQARLLGSEWSAAVALADSGLRSDPRNAPLRVIKVRALIGSGDLAAAASELVALRSSHHAPSVALATLALVLARGGTLEERDGALAPLLGRPANEWRPVLPLIAGTPPGTFSSKTEAAALAAAEKLMAYEPGLASTLAARALAAGGMSRQAAALVQVGELSAEQIATIRSHLAAEADLASAGLSQQIARRQEQAKAIAAEADPEPPAGPPGALARTLRGVLQDFDVLYDPALTSVQVAALPGSGQPFYWPFLVRPQRLREGLLETLMRAPWVLKATPAKVETELLPSGRWTDEGIATLAGELGASAILLYRIRPAGVAPWASLELILYDARHQRSQHIEAALVGRSTGLMMLNPLAIGLAVLLALGLGAWLVVLSLRGTILVRVQWDADAKDELFSLLVSRSPTPPTIENIALYRKKLEWLGERKRRYEAWNVQQTTTFRAIPRGKWYVHLYGIYTRGRQTMLLHEPAQEVEVLPRKTAFVAHVLEAAEAEFRIVVLDDHGPVEGARVWLDDERAKGVTTAKAGMASLKVAKGFHVIRVSAREMTVDRPYHVVKAKVHDMTINLVWERRQEYVSRALERQVDEASEYMRSRPPRASGELPGAATAAATEASALLVAEPPVDLPPAPEPVDLSAPAMDMPVELPSPVDAEAEVIDLPVALPPGPEPQGNRRALTLEPLRPQTKPSAVPSAPTDKRGR